MAESQQHIKTTLKNADSEEEEDDEDNSHYDEDDSSHYDEDDDDTSPAPDQEDSDKMDTEGSNTVTDAPDKMDETSPDPEEDEEEEENFPKEEEDEKSHHSSSEEHHSEDDKEEDEDRPKEDGAPPTHEDEKNQDAPVENKDGTTTESSNKPKKQRKRNGTHDKLLQDCISVEIPLDYTADLAIAVRHTRQKRIAALQKAYPNLAVRKPAPLERGVDGPMSDSGKEDAEEGADRDAPPNKKRKKNSNAPDRSNYSSMLDYLEAKYVKGVMIDHDDDHPDGGNQGDEDDDDDRGSVYSEDSFFDDEALKRDVASQVLANSTTTKMELQESDSEFFVNVGNLEVEETDFTKEHYDPLQDVDDVKKGKVGRRKPGPKPGVKQDKPAAAAPAETKKKTATTPDTAAHKKTPAPKQKQPKTPPPAIKKEPSLANKKEPPLVNKKEPSAAANKKEPSPAAANKKEPSPAAAVKKEPSPAAADKNEPSPAADKKEPPTSTSPLPKKKGKVPTTSKDKSNYINPDLPLMPSASVCKKHPELKNLLKIEAEKKLATEKSYQTVVAMIKEMPEEDLPRRKSKDKVTVTVPSDRKPGDSIFFQNPHVKGQRLKVKIPANAVPGGTFKVTVPVPKPSEDDEEEDHNSWSREFYETLSEFAYCYDAWMDAIQDRQAAVPDEEPFPSHFEKRKKFDQLMNEFPNKELKTPIDKAYLQKILRRARQNKHKRDRTAKRLEEMAQKVMSNPDGGSINDDDGQHTADGSDPSSSSKPPPRSKVAPPPRVVMLPVLGRMFPQVPFLEKEFL